MSCLSISLLGPMSVHLDGQPADQFSYGKVRGLFSYLVVEASHTHYRDALAGTFWPDKAQKAALDSLRNALADLRQTIRDNQASPPYLFCTRDTIQFNLKSDHWLDLERFNQLVEACKVHRHRRIECCQGCAERLFQAVELYHGAFLQGFSLPDSDLFEDWMVTLREQYAQMALDSLEQLAAIYEWRGEYEKALTYTRRQLHLDPCREEAHARAIRLLGIMDRKAEACEQYERCCQHLANELDVDPEKATTHLYQQVKYGIFSGSGLMRAVRLDNLPPSTTSFVGREQELSEINALLDDPGCRLLTLVGPGGVGKTRLALAAATQRMEAFANGASFVALAGISSPDLITTTILQALGLKAEGNDPKEQLLKFIQDKDLLLVLDNFEHLLEGSRVVSEILQAAPNVSVLVTSRRRLNLQAEWLFEVSGLSYPSGKSTHDLAAYEAMQLFITRLHQVKPRLTLFDDDLQGAARICRVVEGLPLGIELAASAVRMKTIQQVATAIETGREDLAIAYKDVPERHRSIRAVFDHSCRMLSEQERSAFYGLSVFRGGFTLEAAEQVAGASQSILGSLVEHSLVRYDSEKERYDLHALVRQYAQEKLISLGMNLSLHDKHLDFYLSLAEQMVELRPKEIPLKNILEIDNFHEALDWSFNNAYMEIALRLVAALGGFWQKFGLWKAGIDWAAKVLDGNYLFPRDQNLARAYRTAGILQRNQDTAKSLESHKKALAIWEELAVPWQIADSLREIGFHYALVGEHQESLAALERSLFLFRQIGDQSMISKVIHHLGLCYSLIDNTASFTRAQQLFEEALQIDSASQIIVNRARILNNLGIQELYRGNYFKARTLFEECIGLLRIEQDYEKLVIGLDSIGLAYYFLEDFDKARESYQESLQISHQQCQNNITTLCNLSYLLFRIGEMDNSLFLFKEVFRHLDNSIELSISLLNGNLQQLPGVLIGCNELKLAAKLFAFTVILANKHHASMPGYLRPDYERDLAETRRLLDEAAFNAAWEEGATMTLEQARELALGAEIKGIS